MYKLLLELLYKKEKEFKISVEENGGLVLEENIRDLVYLIKLVNHYKPKGIKNE